MVGEIVFVDGYCKDCTVAELSINSLYSNSGAFVNHVVYCEHENACRQMKLKCDREQQEEKEK